MFKVFTKKRTMDTIAQELLAMNTTISSFATKLPDQYEFLLSYFCRFDEQKDDLNIACIEHIFLNKEELELKPNLDRDIDISVSKLF